MSPNPRTDPSPGLVNDRGGPGQVPSLNGDPRSVETENII